MGKADPLGSGAPRTRAERRRQAQARRNRLVLVLGIVASVAIVAAWFPASDLLRQRQQLAAASSELHQLNDQNRSLRQQAKQLETPAAVGRIAQQQYDLVKPGEQAYQVLPPSSSDGTGTLTTPTAGTGAGGAPASHAVTGRRAGTAARKAATAARSDFLGRIVQTLEFWR